MGHSLSADVFWGFDLGSDDDYDEDAAPQPQWREDDEEWEEVLARRLGWNEVPFPTDSTPAGYDNYRYATPEYQAWSASRVELRDLVKSIGVEIGSYGYEYGAKAIRVKASVQNCDYGAAPLNDLIVAAEWPEKITQFCELLEIPVPTEGPRWHLCASWG